MKEIVRKDIIKFVEERTGRKIPTDCFVYEVNNLLYAKQVHHEDGIYYNEYSYTFIHDEELRKQVEQVFKIKFAIQKIHGIACKCGDTKNFTCYTEGYYVWLVCNSCKYKFSPYSG